MLVTIAGAIVPAWPSHATATVHTRNRRPRRQTEFGPRIARTERLDPNPAIRLAALRSVGCEVPRARAPRDTSPRRPSRWRPAGRIIAPWPWNISPSSTCSSPIRANHSRRPRRWPVARRPARRCRQQPIAIRAKRRADADLAPASRDRERHQRVDAGGRQDDDAEHHQSDRDADHPEHALLALHQDLGRAMSRTCRLGLTATLTSRSAPENAAGSAARTRTPMRAG